MESLAIAYAYEAYEIAQGIEYELPDFYEFFQVRLLPSSGWLVSVGAMLFSSQILLWTPAIAQVPTYTNPIYGATVNVPRSCLNARRVPSKSGDIYACVKKGTTLKAIVKEENGWYQLASGGWVAKQFVKLPVNNPSPQAATPKTGTSHFSGKGLNRNVENWTYDPKSPLMGDEIHILQEHLNWYKLLAHEVEVTGVYDEQTKLAVEMFQMKRGLPVDGIAGVETRKALQMPL